MAKSIADKIDAGSIISVAQKEDLASLEGTINELRCDTPTHVMDIYKIRRGRHRSARIWCKIDLGTARIVDLFVTDYGYNLIPFEVLRVKFDDEDGFTILPEVDSDEVVNTVTGEIEKREERLGDLI